MIERDYEGFDGLAAMWRAHTPAPVMLSTAPDRYAKAVREW